MMRTIFFALMLTFPLAVHAQTQPTTEQLIAHLDDDPDPLHGDYTPSVHALCARGLDAARAIVPLLDSPNQMTRMHASRVLECAVSVHFGWHAGQGYPPGSDGEARLRALWHTNGDYAFDAAAPARHASTERWAAWLAAHHADAPIPGPASPRSS